MCGEYCPMDSPSKDEEGCKYADKAADKAVRKTFAILGVDMDNPAAIEEFRIVLRFSKNANTTVSKIKITVMVALIGLGTGAIWSAFFAKAKDGN